MGVASESSLASDRGVTREENARSGSRHPLTMTRVLEGPPVSLPSPSRRGTFAFQPCAKSRETSTSFRDVVPLVEAGHHDGKFDRAG
jgi:hypothetical protein